MSSVKKPKSTKVTKVTKKPKSGGSKSVKPYKPIDPNKEAEKFSKTGKYNPEYMKGNTYKPPKDGKTELEKINSNPAYVQAKIDALLEAGRAEITTKEQLMQFPLGSLVSYYTKPIKKKLSNGDTYTVPAKYRSGGFLRARDPDQPYFVLQGGQVWSKISLECAVR